uniref:Uncharacterized protein n=1 Tax=Cannabis sativa TaxID=3483 RepID=A0A803PKS1_CANSA
MKWYRFMSESQTVLGPYVSFCWVKSLSSIRVKKDAPVWVWVLGLGFVSSSKARVWVSAWLGLESWSEVCSGSNLGLVPSKLGCGLVGPGLWVQSRVLKFCGFISFEFCLVSAHSHSISHQVRSLGLGAVTRLLGLILVSGLNLGPAYLVLGSAWSQDHVSQGHCREKGLGLCAKSQVPISQEVLSGSQLGCGPVPVSILASISGLAQILSKSSPISGLVLGPGSGLGSSPSPRILLSSQ